MEEKRSHSAFLPRKNNIPRGGEILRTFIAIELEQDVKEYLASVQTETQKLCRRGNYTPMDNFHLTLHFLGEINEEVPE